MDMSIVASATLAEIYLEQGYVDMSIRIYAELVRREPNNKIYVQRLKYLKKEYKANNKRGILGNIKSKLWGK